MSSVRIANSYLSGALEVAATVANVPSRSQRRGRTKRSATLPRVPVTEGAKDGVYFEVFEVRSERWIRAGLEQT